MSTTKETTKPVDRINEKIRIFLPLDGGQDEKYEQVETVIINGVTTQIKRGEYVDVPFNVYEVLYNSGRYQKL